MRTFAGKKCVLDFLDWEFVLYFSRLSFFGEEYLYFQVLPSFSGSILIEIINVKQ